MPDYRVTYTDLRTQQVTADSYLVEHGKLYVFTHQGRPVLTVAADRIESVAEENVAKAESRKLRSAAI